MLRREFLKLAVAAISAPAVGVELASSDLVPVTATEVIRLQGMTLYELLKRSHAIEMQRVADCLQEANEILKECPWLYSLDKQKEQS